MDKSSTNAPEVGKYRHFKGNYYEVIGLATHSESLEKLVIYRACYGDFGLWARPLAMWNEEVTHEGKLVKRFEKVAEK